MPGPKDDRFDDEAVTTPSFGERAGGSVDQSASPAAAGERTTPYGTTPLSAAATPPPSTADTATLGALRQRYDILNELGRGGMGIVYRARDRETGDVVALKVLQLHIAADKELLERFKSELLLARKITHKNVCRVYDLVRIGDVS